MIMSSSRFPFTGYSRLLQKRNGTFKGFGQEWSYQPGYLDPAPATSTGVPYYLAAPGTDAGGETVYVTPTPTDRKEAGSSSVGSFFTSLFTGFANRFQTPTIGPQVTYYQQRPPVQQSGIPGWAIGAGVVVGAGVLYAVLKK